MNHRNKFVVAIFCISSFMGCKSKKEDFSEELAQDASTETACVGMQGNGIKFPSHVGTFIALLENDITPAVSLGGSSGSIVGAAVMGLLQNPSLGEHSIPFQGKNLTKAQKASIVLATLPDILNSFLFVPAFSELKMGSLEVTPSIIALLVQNQFGHVLAGSSDSRVVSIEATVGQAVLLTDFLMHQNLGSILAKETFKERRAETFRLWKLWANIKETNLKSLFDVAADVTIDGTPSSDQELIADRFFRLFQQDIVQSNSANEVSKWKRLIGAVNSLVKSPEFAFLTNGKLSNISGFKLYLPDPKLLWNAYRGFSKSGNFMILPKGLIVHSTFRNSKIQLDRNGSISATEAVGSDALYQGYIANDEPGKELASELVKIKRSLAGKNRGFLPYYLDSSKNIEKLGYAYPADRVLIFKNYSQARGENLPGEKDDLQANILFREGRRGLAHAMAFSAGEPGPFRRQPVFTDGEDIAYNDVRIADGTLRSPVPVLMGAPRAGESVSALMAFGGWSENVPISTLAMLKSCEGARYFVASGKDGGGNSFQENAIRASIRGWSFIISGFQDFTSALGVHTTNGELETRAHFAKLNQNISFSRTLIDDNLVFKIEHKDNGPVGSWSKLENQKRFYFPNNIEFDIPSRAKVDSKTIGKLNNAIGGDNGALMLASYQQTMANMSSGLLAKQAFHDRRINSFGNRKENTKELDFAFSRAKLYEVTTVAEIQEAISAIR
ncbi:MAG: hypothetical protein WCI18_10410 [Pseudomonadota bacterium]